MISYSAAALIVKDGNILLVKRASRPFIGYWALSGGHKEDYETFEQCVKREVYEETGLCIKDLRFFGCMRVKNRYGLQFALYYLATLCSYTVINQQTEILDTKFFPLKALPSRIVPFHKQIIRDFMAEQSPSENQS